MKENLINDFSKIKKPQNNLQKLLSNTININVKFIDKILQHLINLYSKRLSSYNQIGFSFLL